MPRGTSNTNDRGSSHDRHRRKLWLLAQFGTGTKAPCYNCGTMLDYHSITVDRIIHGADGGRYVRGNIRPSCSPCASEQGGKLGTERKRAKDLQRVILSGKVKPSPPSRTGGTA